MSLQGQHPDRSSHHMSEVVLHMDEPQAPFSQDWPAIRRDAPRQRAEGAIGHYLASQSLRAPHVVLFEMGFLLVSRPCLM